MNTDDSFCFNSEDAVIEQKSIKDDPYQKQIREFAAAIHENRQPWITIEGGLHLFAVCMACYGSAAVKKVVELSKF